jgi:hypothetical protein
MSDFETALIQISHADALLAEADDVLEMLNIRDKATAVAALLRAIQAGYEIQTKATILRIKAERKVGGWLSENVHAGNPNLMAERPVPLEQVGISRWQSHRWQAYATLPDDKFNAWMDEAIAAGHEISGAGLFRYATNSEAKMSGHVPNQHLLLAPTPRQCALQGYMVPCSGRLTGQHIISKQMARGNEEVRNILRACPPELIAQVCEGHNVGKMADSHNGRRILLLQKVYEHGFGHMHDYIDSLPWKYWTAELRLESMLEPKAVKT